MLGQRENLGSISSGNDRRDGESRPLAPGPHPPARTQVDTRYADGTRGSRFLFIAGLTLFYAAAAFALGARKYATFHAGADLGLFVQAVASGASLFNTTEHATHFAVHFSPILWLCAPVLAVWHSPLALTLVQSIAVALTLPPLFAIVLRRASERRAMAVVAIATAYPPLLGLAFTDFHENAFVPALTAAMLWALDGGRFRLAFACALALLCTKEDQAAILALAGFAFALLGWRLGEPGAVRFGSALAVASAAVFALYFTLIQPHAASGSAWSPAHFYDRDAQRLSLATAIWSRLSYLLEAFVPLAFVPFFSPAIVLAAPGFIEVLASRDPVIYTMGQHYTAVWLGYVLVAFALAASHVPVRALRVTAVVCVLALVLANPLHLGHNLHARADQEQLAAFLRTLPPDASIGTQDELFSHLSLDPHAQLGTAGDPQFVVFDTALSSSMGIAQMRPAFLRNQGDRYRLAHSEGGIELYVRKR